MLTQFNSTSNSGNVFKIAADLSRISPMGLENLN